MLHDFYDSHGSGHDDMRLLGYGAGCHRLLLTMRHEIELAKGDYEAEIRASNPMSLFLLALSVIYPDYHIVNF